MRHSLIAWECSRKRRCGRSPVVNARSPRTRTRPRDAVPAPRAALGAGAAGRDDRDRRRVRGLGPPRAARPPRDDPVLGDLGPQRRLRRGCRGVRRPWAAMAAALGSYTAGYGGVGIVYSDGAVPYVSFADALWLGFYPLSYV